MINADTRSEQYSAAQYSTVQYTLTLLRLKLCYYGLYLLYRLFAIVGINRNFCSWRMGYEDLCCQGTQ